MKKENFTADRVNGFKCRDGKAQSIYWDAKTPGLGLRVTAGGAKSYIFESRLHGRTLRITIGDVRTWTIAKAQAEATSLKSLTDKGIDPRQHSQESRAAAEVKKQEAQRRNTTLSDAWEKYLQARKFKWSEKHYSDHISMSSLGGEKRKRSKRKTIAGPLATLMPLKLSELNGHQLAEWLVKQTETRPTAAALSFRMLRAFAGWAADMPEYQNIIPADSFSARKVRESLPKPETKDGDSLQREQLSAWFAEVRKIDNPVIGTYLQALLLTGARREEMAGLRWEDIDFKWRSLTIRDKVEGTRTIPLTPYLSGLLLNLKRINETPPNKRRLRTLEERGEEWKPSQWVFFSKTAAKGRIQEPRIAHNKALDAAALPHISLHGLRRSFGTLCEWVEVPSGISAQIMGHKPSALAEKHYRRRPLDLLRKWHDTIEAWMLEQAGITFAKPEPELRIIAVAN